METYRCQEAALNRDMDPYRCASLGGLISKQARGGQVGLALASVRQARIPP